MDLYQFRSTNSKWTYLVLTRLRLDTGPSMTENKTKQKSQKMTEKQTRDKEEIKEDQYDSNDYEEYDI